VDPSRRDLACEPGALKAIDDFGTGDSSMAYLRQFSEGTALLHTLVQLGKALGLAVVA
jgi:EAL domain-containing protein (putative c-di-GMP-specific phosphodiesterase class I)